jgi:hypothetical protein
MLVVYSDDSEDEPQKETFTVKRIRTEVKKEKLAEKKPRTGDIPKLPSIFDDEEGASFLKMISLTL